MTQILIKMTMRNHLRALWLKLKRAKMDATFFLSKKKIAHAKEVVDYHHHRRCRSRSRSRHCSRAKLSQTFHLHTKMIVLRTAVKLLCIVRIIRLFKCVPSKLNSVSNARAFDAEWSGLNSSVRHQCHNHVYCHCHIANLITDCVCVRCNRVKISTLIK